jgi:hypothetical protein
MKVTFIAQQHKYNPDSAIASLSGRNITRPKRLGQADQKKEGGGKKKKGRKKRGKKETKDQRQEPISRRPQ